MTSSDTELSSTPAVGVWPPTPLTSEHFFVLKQSEGVPGQDYGKTYVADQKTPNALKLQQAVESGEPVYCFIYRLAPESSLTAWSQVTGVSTPADTTQLIFQLNQHEFPIKIHYRGSMSRRLPWITNLGKPGLSIQSISQPAFEAVIDWAKELERLLKLAQANAGYILKIVTTKKEQFNNTANFLLESTASKTLHLQYEILEIIQKVEPLKIDALNPENWLHRVMSEDGRFTNLGNNSNLWRLAEPGENSVNTTVSEVENEATLADVPTAEDLAEAKAFEFEEAELNEPEQLGTQPETAAEKPAEIIPEDTEQLSIAQAAELVLRQTNQSLHISQILTSLEEQNLRIIKGDKEQQRKTLRGVMRNRPHIFYLEGKNVWSLLERVPTLVDAPLRILSPDEFAAKLRELATDLLFDEQVVRRIYRSLIAGHHVVLSGPPGTGKTELARRLPELLWREDVQEQMDSATDENVTDDIKQENQAKQKTYEGYYAYVVTATEDWGVRDVVGGIGPRLGSSESSETAGTGNGVSSQLAYTIQYGELTRAILQNYKDTEKGQQLPPDLDNPVRVAYIPAGQKTQADNLLEKPRQYRGVWLVIDEFTRAPVDAAFGPLLTTLGNSASRAYLVVPSDNNQNVGLLLPQDFRIIGTLNSFDRHFLNQISEALKRRFDFIDVLPPTYQLRAAEQGIGIKRALEYLVGKSFAEYVATSEPVAGEFSYSWDGRIQLTLTTEEIQGLPRQVYNPQVLGTDQENPDVRAVLLSFWRIFEAIRVFRQLGTAQAVAVYTNLFAGALTGMDWKVALDTALADTLADQLQVLNRDEQEILLTYLAQADNPNLFKDKFEKLWKRLSTGRQRTLANILRQAAQERTTANEESTELDVLVDDETPTGLTQLVTQLPAIFTLGETLALPPVRQSQFYKRLSNLIYERGL